MWRAYADKWTSLTGLRAAKKHSNTPWAVSHTTPHPLVPAHNEFAHPSYKDLPEKDLVSLNNRFAAGRDTTAHSVEDFYSRVISESNLVVNNCDNVSDAKLTYKVTN